MPHVPEELKYSERKKFYRRSKAVGIHEKSFLSTEALGLIQLGIGWVVRAEGWRVLHKEGWIWMALASSVGGSQVDSEGKEHQWMPSEWRSELVKSS
jgi:hypothetical protein